MKKFLMFVVAVIILLYISNSWIQTTEISVESDRVPTSFDGVKILQISDLHDATFGENQEKLVKKVKKTDPDLIFITGDLIDSNRYNLDQSLELVRQIVDLAPIYYVTGNHEIATNDIENIKNSLTELGVNVLSNEEQIIEHKGEDIRIIGIEDPLNGILVNEALSQFEENDLFTLVLSHRPETFQDYVDYKMDVVFSGHAHGGQFRLPGLGGLVAPGQGLFPSYTAGMYSENNTHMIVSRGLGNSAIPVRIFNSPEIVVVTLKSL
ncbi:metallophosphoesterase [Psychrobacillus psychrodurans]|uniref:Metallophosphoesterase n=1 Tax=Psychrobacillus psychrodurans TaxID=126157 RepID=A0A9X3RB15_9BACI|nr:metallophosphoesterase [Psychrobacillus psychrodurans]MCZ8535080.1 metallophosphoesterase [Psychrobacillus psychrodurans]